MHRQTIRNTNTYTVHSTHWLTLVARSICVYACILQMKTIFCVCDWTAQYKLQNTHTVHTCMHLYIHIIEPIEKALGYKIIIIVKRTAAPFGILFGVIVNVCAYVCVDVGILWILKIVSKYVNNVARFFHSFALSLCLSSSCLDCYCCSRSYRHSRLCRFNVFM